MQTNLSESISKRTALEDVFGSLSRKDREEAYKAVRAKVGYKTVTLKDLVEAHRQIDGEVNHT
jgi:hypothetical protein